MRYAALLAAMWAAGCSSADDAGHAQGAAGTNGSAAGGGADTGGGAGGAMGFAGSGGDAVAGAGGTAFVASDSGSPGSPDAGSADAKTSDGARPPAGLVPMFVASGQGGRTITSCDDGKTWIADHAYETVDTTNINYVSDSPYASKGLAYGQGTFIALMAWGGPASLKISDDGVNWTRVFNKLADSTGGFFGGLGFGGGAFVLIRQKVTQLSTDQGKTWSPATAQPGGDFREAGGGDDVGIFGGGSGDDWMSWDGGKTWKAASGCPSMGFGAIGEYGGIAAGGGNLVMVGDKGQTCRVFAGGTQYQVGSLGEAATGKVFFTGEKFWVMNGTKAFTSDDGGTWKSVALEPAGTSIQSIARGISGTYAGAYRGGGRFYRSSDGINWTPATAPAKGNQIFRMVAGYGKASAMCPAPLP